MRDAAEAQIVEKQRDVDYDTKEYPVETVVDKYSIGLATDENEIFIPDYQRDLSWDKRRQSRFIESVLIGLPVPYVFVADVSTADKTEARLEVVDGSQRIRTLYEFMKNRLALVGLKKLDSLNGFKFSDMPPARQRRFARRTLRMIELTEKADEEIRRDIFERINTGSDELREMEKRRGIRPGPMTDFLSECAKLEIFQRMVPIAAAAAKRREREELVLRFFAYLDRYGLFKHSVVKFLDEYLKDMNSKGVDGEVLKHKFVRMLEFVEGYFPLGFKKASTHTVVSRIRFEAIAVGVALALDVKPGLVPKDKSWLESPELRRLTTSDASNSRVKVVGRIEFVRDSLLAE
jgi:hypothetical protein